MAQTTLSFRVDDSLKKSFEALCKEWGFTNASAITGFMKAVVRERKMPIELHPNHEEINQKGWEAFLKMRHQVAEEGLQEMTLEDINALIQKVRDAQ